MLDYIVLLYSAYLNNCLTIDIIEIGLVQEIQKVHFNKTTEKRFL